MNHDDFLDDLKVDENYHNNDDRTLELLRRDFSILIKGIEGKKLGDINLDAIMEFLERLKNEVQDVKDGICARDHFFSYTANMREGDITSMFSKEPNFSEENERVNE